MVVFLGGTVGTVGTVGDATCETLRHQIPIVFYDDGVVNRVAIAQNTCGGRPDAAR